MSKYLAGLLISLLIMAYAPATETYSEYNTLPPQNRLHVPKPPPVSRNNVTQGQEMIVQATAYSHTGQQTYTGTWPKEGRTIAVDPETIPMGSRVYIEGFGWRVAEDKIPLESVAKGAKVDIFMDNENDCWEWGRRNVRIIVFPPQEED